MSNLIGKKAPLFKSTAVVNGKDIVHDFSLQDFVGKQAVMFFFYPKDFTFVCPTELLAFQAALNEFKNRNVAVVGCSTDTEETHLAWLRTPKPAGGIQGITYPQIADASKVIAANYGVLAGSWSYNDEGVVWFEGLPIAYRGTFFIDDKGLVRYVSINDLPLGRNINELLRIVDMWNHVQQFGEVCPANWQLGQEGMQPTYEGVVTYLTNER
jgi:peroxiredoxin (alkyl hydroperoxide reductase subunit C)